ncbi:DUF6705 family protein [uncultured Flavobacterium sp.]|uniref:DUF6705 family protein n=1 Tax=uncultured Flavobacterium sp. TaxID=165435 RepID=UPI002599E9DD|nr:DUF6705 family protein [uncultured Flavobacterium sp.]
MKNIIKIMLLVLTFTSCKAQSTYPLSSAQLKHKKNNNYIKDTEHVYDNFAGTWQWTNGTSTFTIKLQKVEYWKAPNDNYYKDLILGGYRYEENGNVLVDKLNFTTSFTIDPATWVDFAEMIGSISYPDINELGMIVNDYIKNKSCMAELTLQIGPNGEQQLQWYLHDFETYRDPSLGPKLLDFSIPTNVVLTKL